jgi:hypothetical protein
LIKVKKLAFSAIIADCRLPIAGFKFSLSQAGSIFAYSIYKKAAL